MKRRVSKRPRRIYLCQRCDLPLRGHPRRNNKLFHAPRKTYRCQRCDLPVKGHPRRNNKLFHAPRTQVVVPAENTPPQVQIITGENITGKKRKREKVEEEEEKEEKEKEKDKKKQKL